MKEISQLIFNSPLDTNHHVKIPWRWMPTLYLFKGLAFVVLFFVSLVAFKRVGLANGEITFFTAWFLLPCVMRPVLSILVHTGHHNRLWILGTQLLTVLATAGIGYILSSKPWLEGIMLCYWVIAFANVFHDIATDKFSMRAINHQHVSSLRIFKLIFYQLALLIGLGIMVMIAGNLEVITRAVRGSWSTAFYSLSAFLLILLGWHTLTVPRTTATLRERKIRAADMFYACLNTSADLIRTPRSWPGILFLTCFLLPCALLMPVSILFMLDLGSSGGMGLAPQEFGYVQGTVGVFGLMTGGILGLWLITTLGLKRLLPFMALSVLIPSFIYIYLSYALPQRISWIACCTFVQQLAYGFGLCAYLRYIVHYSEVKRFSTYTLCMSLVSVGIMIPMLMAGSLQEAFGYRRFFMMTAVCGIATLLVSMLSMSDPELDEANGSKAHQP